MNSGSRKHLASVLASLVALAVLAVAPSASAQPLTGVYHGEVFSQPRAIDAYSEWLGYEVTLAQGHQDKDTWENIENPTWQLGAWSRWVKAKPGRRLNYSVSIFPEGQGSLAQCAQGQYDFRFRNLATHMVNAGLQRSIIRVGWEFSGFWMPWYAGNGQEANYAECFRRIVTAMRTSQPSAGFEFDWNPNYDISPAMMTATYPGNAYVDYIGFDLYDQGWQGRYPIPSTCTGQCRLDRWKLNWDVQFAPALTKFRDFAQARGKRLSVPEWGVNDPATTGGGDNTWFVQQMLAFIFNPANNVGYHSYFDWQAGDGHHQLSDVDANGGHTFQTEFPNAAALYKAHFAGTPPPPPGTVTTTRATVSPTTVTRGQSFQVAGSVTASSAMTVNVKYEIRSVTGSTLIVDRIYGNQAFTAGQTRSFNTPFTIGTDKPAGTYRVDTLVYSADWSKTLLYRNDTTFTVN
ncbi:beta-mannanase [Pyxidicoccus fallax]|uniref:Beta-mannanase n=1 Tax=Pyxidicoccus fallax TaxID=394095 RepID=A0A848L489_9BACT|nr:glycosyl hydrolase [Pyxidicoccus fallax]NMO13780.1 beta-mannanase [Pyxidicoccus fallax]NPC77033.1 beta-mannanase [Pyxidicoccus fallax]